VLPEFPMLPSGTQILIAATKGVMEARPKKQIGTSFLEAVQIDGTSDFINGKGAGKAPPLSARTGTRVAKLSAYR
jgi:hypothetical protein